MVHWMHIECSLHQFFFFFVLSRLRYRILIILFALTTQVRTDCVLSAEWLNCSRIQFQVCFFFSLQQKWTVKSTTYELVGTIHILLITEKVNTKAKAKWNNTIKTVANNKKKRKRRISKYKHIVAAAASFVIIILVFLSFNLLLWNDD